MQTAALNSRIVLERHAPRLRSSAWVVAAAWLVTGCSGGSGADVVQNPAGAPPVGSDYTGPAPATADVQSFKINLWDNIRANNRCGACHGLGAGQSPLFARADDVNLAYVEANGIVDLGSPDDSLMVTKVGGGHNCWLTSDAACADILATWITNWAGELATGAARKIELEAPQLRDPGESKSYPDDDGALFKATVYDPVLEPFCSGCHSSSAPAQQAPFFAEGPGTDPAAIATAYAAAKSKMNLDDPARSRFVLRLREEFHNCWTVSCADDAVDMENAIAQFAASIEPTAVDPALLASKALGLYDGTIASGGNRYEANVVALYEFKTGQGLTAFDTSGVEPAMDLMLSGNVEWVGGWGLNFSGGKAQASTASSAKLRTQIAATGEFSVEAWVAPGNVVQEDTRIVSYSAGTMARNFNLGQTLYNYDYFVRSSNSDANGNPQLSTPDAAEVLQATLQHVVATFDPVVGRKIYVNGVLVAELDPAPGGSLADWDDTFAFVLGNEVSGDRPWSGVIRLVAIHNRVLNQAQVLQNFEAGVGEKFFLLFGVEHLVNVPESFVVFEASQFDSYAYLFRNPFFISLNTAASPDGIDIRGIRVGINGAEANVGQAFANVAATISSSIYSAATGQALASLGTVLPLEKGPESDEFFLTFDTIGGSTYNRPPPETPPAPLAQDLPPASAIGVHTFDEIDASMAVLTGIDRDEAAVLATFDTIRQSLPAVPTLEAFLASHQVAVAQLAIEYCNALIEDPNARSELFPAFPFDADVATAYPGRDSVNSNALLDPLLDRVLGTIANSIASQPDRAAVKAEIEDMIYGYGDLVDPPRPGLANGGGSTERNETIAKAACAALVGSAAMLVQ